LNGPSDTSAPILVLQVNGSAFSHGPLGIARSAGRMGVDVYGVVPRPTPGARSRYWAGHFAHPGEAAGSAEWVELLSGIGSRLPRCVLIPTDDTATLLVASQAEKLRQCFSFPDQPAELIRRLSDKAQMHHLCGELDIPVPLTEFPSSGSKAAGFAEISRYPVVVKRIAAWRPARGPSPPSVIIAESKEELLAAYDRMECPEEPNVMLQEYIPGGSESIWMFNGYFDRRSECLVGFTGQKLRQRGPHTGPATLGLCTDNPTVHEMTRRLMKSVGYRGVLDLGYRFDARDGLYKLLDVNPRIGETFRLFVGANGLDVLGALYRDMTGQPVPPTTARNHRKWVVEPFDLVSSAQLWREGELRPLSWFRSLRGIDEAAWFARDDPLPFAAMVTRLAREASVRGRGPSRGPAPGPTPAVGVREGVADLCVPRDDLPSSP
jgi:D-aspartate ligase